MDAPDFIQKAKEYGAADVRFVRPDEFTRWETDAETHLKEVHISPLYPDPRALLENARSVAVLFFPAPPFAERDALYPRYYIVSQQGYWIARRLVEILRTNGVNAIHGTKLPHRAAALRSGGVLGCNGLYYHSGMGSCLHIELIVNDAFDPQSDGTVSECSRCGRCIDVCPTGALTESGLKMSRCIRNCLFSQMPAEFRVYATQMLGCERCQRVCPLNGGIKAIPIRADEAEALSLQSMLTGQLDAAKDLIGNNLIRKRRMVVQALLVIGARKLGGYEDLLENIAADVPGDLLDWVKSRIVDGIERI